MEGACWNLGRVFVVQYVDGHGGMTVVMAGTMCMVMFESCVGEGGH